ncbi:hypothetical protein KIPB_012687, partial [Kipferlia bialata]
FLQQTTQPEGFTLPLYVLIGDTGIGKSWSVAHLCERAICLRGAIPYLFPLRHQLDLLLQRVFGSSDPSVVGARCMAYRETQTEGEGEGEQTVGKPLGLPLLVLDGFDKLVSAKKESLLTWLHTFLESTSGRVPVVLTCRTHVWPEDPVVDRALDTLYQYIYNGEEGYSHALTPFTDLELADACGRRRLAETDIPGPLRPLCARPSVLGMLSADALRGQGSGAYTGEDGKVSLGLVNDRLLPLMGVTSAIRVQCLGPFLHSLVSAECQIEQDQIPEAVLNHP